jgi:hypothetical protein
VTATDAGAVVRALGLRTVLPANWASGLADAAREGVFVTPAVRGTVLATGADVAAHDLEGALLPLLQRLSRAFGSAAWFRSDGERDEFGWAIATGGELVRAYAYSGEHGHAGWHGDVTPQERALGCFVDDPRDRSDDEIKWWPDRRTVHALAAAWSLDPDTLPAHASQSPCGVGAVGRL